MRPDLTDGSVNLRNMHTPTLTARCDINCVEIKGL